MREIKFRGKNQDGKWMIGSLVTHNGGCNIISSPNGRPRAVYPETVGQFTGLHDVYGHEIYEGDIVETFSISQSNRQVGNYPPPNVEVEEYDIERIASVVEFSYGSFNTDKDHFPLAFKDLWEPDPNGSLSDDMEETFWELWDENYKDIQDKYPYLTWNHFLTPYVIGNIHDNPELTE
jgi:YopX protein